MEEKPVWQALLSGTDMIANRRLNDAASEVNSLAARNAEAARQIATLFELDKAQARDIARLQSAVWLLMQMLTESGALDASALAERLKTALAEVDRQQALGPSTPSFP